MDNQTAAPPLPFPNQRYMKSFEAFKSAVVKQTGKLYYIKDYHEIAMNASGYSDLCKLFLHDFISLCLFDVITEHTLQFAEFDQLLANGLWIINDERGCVISADRESAEACIESRFTPRSYVMVIYLNRALYLSLKYANCLHIKTKLK